MNTILRLSALLTLGAALAAPAGAALESIKFDSENVMPQYPLPLRMAGVTRGQAIVAIAVDAEGKLSDWLVLGYTDESLARSAVAALKEWRYTPARIDGAPVPAQVRLTFDFTLEGAVISANIVNHFLFDHIEGMGDGHMAYRLHSSSEIDRVPARVTTTLPLYAEAAAKQGVRGKLQVRFYIDETGAVRMPSVDAGAQPYLAETAVTALREWKFEPPTRYGRPVLVAASQEFDFTEKK